jgi:hypothetical protein
MFIDCETDSEDPGSVDDFEKKCLNESLNQLKLFIDSCKPFSCQNVQAVIKEKERLQREVEKLELVRELMKYQEEIKS